MKTDYKFFAATALIMLLGGQILATEQINSWKMDGGGDPFRGGTPCP